MTSKTKTRQVSGPASPWLVASLFAALVLMVSLATISMLLSERQSLLDKAGLDARNQAIQTANTLGNLTLYADGIALEGGSQQFLDRGPTMGETGVPDVAGQLSDDGLFETGLSADARGGISKYPGRLIEALPGLRGFAAIDPQGKMVAATHGFPRHVDRAWFTRLIAQHRDLWLDPVVTTGPEAGLPKHLSSVSRGIWGANGQFVGLGIVTVDLRRVAEQLLADDRFGNTHLSAVLDDGRILITLQGAAIQFRAEDSWYAPDRLLNARTQQALGGSSLTDLAVAAQGTGAMIIRDALSRDFPISVFAQVPIEVVLGDWRTRAERFALVLGVLLLVLGGMGFLYMRQERARRSAVQSLIAEEQRLSFALDATGVGLWDWSIGTGQVYFSQENASMLKEPSGARLDRFEDWVARLHPEDQEAFRQQIGAALQQPDQPLLVDFRLRRTDGPWIWVRCRGKVVEQDRHGQPIRMIGTNTDVTASKSREIDLEYQGLHDALTGLGNRRAFDRLVAGVGARVERQRTLAAGVMFDLDHFKKVNDTYGHDVGDLVLQEVAKRVQEALSADERDQVFRVGGEEFALVLPDLREQGAAERAECIRTVIGSRPFALPNGVTLTVTVSLGVSVLQDGAGRRDWMALFKTADQALYHSKQNGRNRVTVVPQPRLEDASQHSGQGNTDPSLWTAAE